IGKLVLADHFGREYAQVCMAAENADLPLLNAELDQFAASHADIGGYLLGLWGLPQDLIEAVALHHDPSSHDISQFTPLTAVHVANALVHLSGEPLDAPTTLRTTAKLDRRYLSRLRCERRLRDWQELAAAMTVGA
ncbi:MAG: HDOD domain-containing protein, partial [Pirellulales bacterium]|nr:HDOD domain-containing protein [Pirellulales bacterium]